MLFKINYIQVPMNIEEKTKVRNQGEISLITTIPKTYVKNKILYELILINKTIFEVT